MADRLGRVVYMARFPCGHEHGMAIRWTHPHSDTDATRVEVLTNAEQAPARPAHFTACEQSVQWLQALVPIVEGVLKEEALRALRREQHVNLLQGIVDTSNTLIKEYAGLYWDAESRRSALEGGLLMSSGEGVGRLGDDETEA